MSGDPVADRLSDLKAVARSPYRTPFERATLAAEWRTRAVSYDGLAAIARREGDHDAAEDYEGAANDYRIAADQLEAEGGYAG